jgi:hypothetical protein
MKRQKCAMFIIFLVMAFLNGQSSIAGSKELSLEKFANVAMSRIQADNFENLFKDFYLPPEYSDIDRENDREAIIAGLRELFGRQLGPLNSFSKIESLDQETVNLLLATGTKQTRSLPSVDLIYKADFRGFGEGYVIIGIHERNNTLLLKYIAVGLPLSNPKSMKIGREFANFMIDIATEQQKRESSHYPKSRTSI